MKQTDFRKLLITGQIFTQEKYCCATKVRLWVGCFRQFGQTRWQYENGVKDPSLLDPTTWLVDEVGLDRPGNSEVQMDLFLSYGTNVPLYPKFQEFFRKYHPPSLIVWGKNDFIFPAAGTAPYARDLKDVETHLLDTGHFALETHCDETAEHMERFLLRRLSA